MWEYQLEAGGYATPSTFQVNGKQFVIIAGGGLGKPGTKEVINYIVLDYKLSPNFYSKLLLIC